MRSMDWSERQAQWNRFAEWEAAQLRERPANYAAALDWMWEAWNLASQADPEWGSEARREEHIRHLQQIRAQLSHLRPSR